MVAEAKTIHVAPNSEIGKLLDEAAEHPIVLERDGDRFRVTREKPDPFANYDPEKALTGIRAIAGLLKGTDVEQLKADLREERGQDSIGRPADR